MTDLRATNQFMNNQWIDELPLKPRRQFYSQRNEIAVIRIAVISLNKLVHFSISFLLKNILANNAIPQRRLWQHSQQN
jgi:hypothetical protein